MNLNSDLNRLGNVGQEEDAGESESRQNADELGRHLLDALSGYDPKESLVLHFLHAGTNVDMRDGQGGTPLIRAARKGLSSVVLRLLELGVDVNAQNSDGETALMIAAGVGNQWSVEALVDAGSDVHLRDNSGSTAIHCAANHNGVGCLAKILNAGADVNAVNDEGRTPLMVACRQWGGEEAVRILLQHGADPNISTPRYDTALLIACKGSSQEVIMDLITHAADIHTRDQNSKTPLMTYVSERQGRLDDEALSALLQGTAIHRRDNQGRSALIHAARGGSRTMAALHVLLDAGADIHARDDKDHTPLMYAAEENNYDAVEELIARGADVNARNHMRRTPLILASQRGGRYVGAELLSTITILIDAGADMDTRDSRGHNVFYYLHKNERERELACLTQRMRHQASS